jgi:anti-sigma B factor antagonist
MLIHYSSSKNEKNTMNIKKKFEKSTTIFSLSGNALSDLDMIKLKQMITNAVNSGTRYLVLDFHRVKHINSVGIGGLLYARKALEKVQGGVKLTRVNESVMSILKRTALERFFQTYLTIEQALQNS